MANTSSPQPKKSAEEPDQVTRCPFCGDTRVAPFPSGNHGVLYVAEETGDSTECFDHEIQQYRCPGGHVFYAL